MHPNILLITWHDAGRWFGCYGNDNVHTPHVDALAAQGCRFENTVAACAICSPSRAAIATGRFSQDNGVMFLANGPVNNRIHPSERHLARRLKEDHGYHTALFGVQHEAAHEHVSEIFAVDERFATDPWPDSAHTSAECFERWLAGRAGRPGPFYAQIGLHEAHMNRYYHGRRDLPTDEHGIHVPPYLKDTPTVRETMKVLQGQLRQGDAAVGRILAALREAGLERDTLVCMCVDHGVGLPRAKTTCYDAGTGVAWLVRYPAQVPAGTRVPAMTRHVDVLPTLLDLAGLAIPETVQGVSFAEHARGRRSDEQVHEAFSHMVENTRSIRTHRHKFIRHFRPGKPSSQSHGLELVDQALWQDEHAPPPRVELYDLQADPNEFDNLAADPAHAEVLAELDGRLWDFLLDRNDFLVNEPARDDWQAQTRRELEAHCTRTARPAPVIDSKA